MMTTSLETSLFRAAATTFEELGFLFPSRDLDDAQSDAAPAVAVEVGFDGETAGALIVQLCGDILGDLAANMLGQEEAPEERLQLDALGEVANVICGNVLPTLAGGQAVYRLEAPRPVATAVEPAQRPRAHVRVGLDGGRADIWLVAAGEVAV
jgi:CheY-specific phosphatase CheX